MEKTSKASRFVLTSMVLIFFCILLISGCRQARLPFLMTISPTITATSPLTPTLTAPPSTPLPTVTPTETATMTMTMTMRPTATVTATITEVAPNLSADAVWLAYLSENGASMTVLNQDGTGRALLVKRGYNENWSFDFNFCDQTDDPSIGWDPASRAAIFGESVYFVNHSKFMRKLGLCIKSGLVGDTTSGLLAVMERVDTDKIAELTFYEIPGGQVRDRFPQVKCRVEAKCSYESAWQVILWSPDKRYLAFSASWESASTDLYVYDRQERSVRKLTSGPDGGGRSVLGWSPDGAWIITQDFLHAGGFTTSLSAVSLIDGETHQLYTSDESVYQGILDWLDDKRFLAYTPSGDPGSSGSNLILADVSGNSTMLFNAYFHSAQLDRAHGIVGIESLGAYNPEYRLGMYLVSINDLTATYIDDYLFYDWNNDLGVFVAGVCPEDPAKIKTLDSSGKIECIEAPAPVVPVWPDHYPSLDEKWQVVLKDGQAFLEGQGISTAIPSEPITQVVWCPDSTCFFFVANKTLYRASVPELVIQMIDEGLEADTINYQWLYK